jgi:hypothetical protein
MPISFVKVMPERTWTRGVSQELDYYARRIKTYGWSNIHESVEHTVVSFLLSQRSIRRAQSVDTRAHVSSSDVTTELDRNPKADDEIDQTDGIQTDKKQTNPNEMS